MLAMLNSAPAACKGGPFHYNTTACTATPAPHPLFPNVWSMEHPASMADSTSQ